jgi:hypothetical protein
VIPHHEPILKCFFPIFDLRRDREEGASPQKFPFRGLGFYGSISKVVPMLYTIAVVLIILWLLGVVSSYTMGGFIHILLVIAIIVILLRVVSGRNAV